MSQWVGAAAGRARSTTSCLGTAAIVAPMVRVATHCTDSALARDVAAQGGRGMEEEEGGHCYAEGRPPPRPACAIASAMTGERGRVRGSEEERER